MAGEQRRSGYGTLQASQFWSNSIQGIRQLTMWMFLPKELVDRIRKTQQKHKNLRDQCFEWLRSGPQGVKKWNDLRVDERKAVGKLGRYLAAVSQGEGSLLLWDAKGNREVWQRKLSGEHMSVTFSPGSTTIASAAGQTIVLWDIRKGEPIHFLKGHRQWVDAMVLSPDGKMLVSGGDETILASSAVAIFMAAFILAINRYDSPSSSPGSSLGRRVVGQQGHVGSVDQHGLQRQGTR